MYRYLCNHILRAAAHKPSRQGQVSCEPDNSEVCIWKGMSYQSIYTLYGEDNHALGFIFSTAAVLVCAESAERAEHVDCR